MDKPRRGSARAEVVAFFWHAFIGAVVAGISYLNPILGFTGALGFYFYERNEDRWLKDGAYLDVKAFLVGLIGTGAVVALLILVSSDGKGVIQ